VTPRGERLVRRGLWAGAGLFASGAFGLLGVTFLGPTGPRPLEGDPPAARAESPSITPSEIDEFARKSPSRTIVKAPPPTPPKPVLPALDAVLRLSGIIDYGGTVAREAFIELRSTGVTKPYHAGDAVPNVGAVVREVTDVVLLEYDGQLWRLTDHGAEPAPKDPLTTSAGAKP